MDNGKLGYPFTHPSSSATYPFDDYKRVCGGITSHTSTPRQNAEIFDPKAEAIFAYLQVFSAICVMFAHGAGEVGCVRGCLVGGWGVQSKMDAFSQLFSRNTHPPTPTHQKRYMSGPLSCIYDIYKNEELSKKLVAPMWVTFISAFSLVVGTFHQMGGGKRGISPTHLLTHHTPLEYTPQVWPRMATTSRAPWALKWPA